MTTHKSISYSILLLLLLPMFSLSDAWANTDKVLVIYFSTQERGQFESRVKPFFEKQTHNCKSCQIVDQTPYLEQGGVNFDLLKEQIEKSPDEAKIIFFDFNERYNEKKHLAIIEVVKKKLSEGHLVVASTGAAGPNQPTIPLSKTLFGQIDSAFIIGELEPGNRLRGQSFFGPQIFTAVFSPRELAGQGYGSLLFVSRFANSFAKRDSTQWAEFLKAKKAKSRSIWPDIDEFFVR